MVCSKEEVVAKPSKKKKKKDEEEKRKQTATTTKTYPLCRAWLLENTWWSLSLDSRYTMDVLAFGH